ncbi:AfsR/SARP family transcriptional regulator [Nonomuraea jiangxiensis]|uniref:DNA-binding transcriptional activator of the SARP family n=1 Tax=Nonomuraea jiangxiensis TaxID=633440 RepID=A0A1G8Q5L1_9ACTN|nr:BTAD domain-containing putative transcriptional regulator [Nonomuraea jiangxiensis]SDJ00003.1 DNA-binding transcriptional activator of the SARP family [Nonomuraea jiangxiensis]
MWRRMLAVLLCRAGEVTTIDDLIDALWHEHQPRSARKTAQLYVHRLRHALGDGDRIVHSAAGYAIVMAPEEMDARRFTGLVAEGRAARHRGDLEVAGTTLRQALALWRGPAYSGLDDIPLIDAQARYLEAQRVLTYEELVAVQLDLGRHAELAVDLPEITRTHLYHERLRAYLMLALYRSGRRAEALEVHSETRQTLDTELGVEPGPLLRWVHEAVLRDDETLMTISSEKLDLTASGADPRERITAARRPAAEPDEVPAPAAPPQQLKPPSSYLLPAQLPPDLNEFTGRETHLEKLETHLPDDTAREPAAMVISAISGTAGVGKTTLAVHWAHRTRDRFSDGQLYVNLRGFGPSESVMPPSEAIRCLLDGLGVANAQIPTDLNAQIGLYRSSIAGKRVLILLDNARDAEQVRPLLPGAPGCHVVVTSRNRLSGLVALEGAQPLILDLPTESEGYQFMAARLGQERVGAEPETVAEIITRCARLPLALSVVAARAAMYPAFPLAALARELRESRGGLDAFADGDSATDVRAVFSWSYHTLGKGAARLFRLLSLHPGPDIPLPAAASLAGLPLRETRALLTELSRAHLINEVNPGRYGLHDLLCAYAAEQAQEPENQDDVQAARHRMLDHYLHTGHAAALLLNPHREPITLVPARKGVVLEELADREQAMTWFNAEHSVLLAVIEQAAATGFDTHVWQLAWALFTFFQRRGHWQDQAATHHAGLSAAQRLADRAGQALAHHGLGVAYTHLGRHDEAVHHLRRGLDLLHELGDVPGQALAHYHFCWLSLVRGDYEQALPHARRSLDLYEGTEERYGRANSLNAYGWCLAQLGHHDQALAYFQQAISLHEEIGAYNGQAASWDSLGFAYHHLGRYEEAITCYETSLRLVRISGDRLYEAETLDHLGDTHHRVGDHDAARRDWRQALDILDELRHPAADAIRPKLHRPPPS